MTPEQLSRFEKLVRLTQSDNDNEALLALRQAQKLCGNDLLGFLVPKAGVSQFQSDEQLEILRINQKHLEKKIKLLESHIMQISGARKIDKDEYRDAVYSWADNFLQEDVDDWISTADLKSFFEEVYSHYSSASITLFSRCLSEALNLRAIKRFSGQKGYSVALKI